MSHLRIVRDAAPKPARRKVRGRPYTADLLTAEEQTRARQALRNLRDAYGTWSCLADAMKVPRRAVTLAMTRGRISPAMLFAASKASGISIADMLAGPVPADRCRACGGIKRAS